MAPVRIGINALYLLPGGVGGTEIYLRSLLDSLAALDEENEYFVFVNRETGGELVPGSPRFHVVPCAVAASFRPSRILYEQTALCRLLRSHRIDVVFNPGYTAPLLADCPSVTVFHDLQHKKRPEFFRRRDLPFWNLLLWASARSARRIIAVSSATAADVSEWMPRCAGKTIVIPHGTDPAFFELGKARVNGSRQGRRPYILTASTLHPHKNVERLLESFAQFNARRADYRLVVAGLPGFATNRVTSMAAELGLGEAVEFTGWVPRERLYKLFENADAFIAPSLFEGFGLTLLEAMAAGLPLACSGIEPFQSLTLDAAHHFDPHSVSEIVAALERITQDEAFRETAASAGPARALRFTWHATAVATLRELISAARLPGPKNTASIAVPPLAM